MVISFQDLDDEVSPSWGGGIIWKCLTPPPHNLGKNGKAISFSKVRHIKKNNDPVRFVWNF